MHKYIFYDANEIDFCPQFALNFPCWCARAIDLQYEWTTNSFWIRVQKNIRNRRKKSSKTTTTTTTKKQHFCALCVTCSSTTGTQIYAVATLYSVVFRDIVSVVEEIEKKNQKEKKLSYISPQNITIVRKNTHNFLQKWRRKNENWLYIQISDEGNYQW